MQEFLLLMKKYFRFKVVTKSYGRRARVILHYFDRDRQHVLTGCPKLDCDEKLDNLITSAGEEGANSSPTNEAKSILQLSALQLRDCMEGVVFVPDHICAFHDKEKTYVNIKECKKTLEMIYKFQTYDEYKTTVVILDDYVTEWLESANMVSMVPFRDNLDDTENYINGADGGELGLAILKTLVSLNVGVPFTEIQQELSQSLIVSQQQTVANGQPDNGPVVEEVEDNPDKDIEPEVGIAEETGYETVHSGVVEWVDEVSKVQGEPGTTMSTTSTTASASAPVIEEVDDSPSIDEGQEGMVVDSPIAKPSGPVIEEAE
eukprot:TRINITY_DN86089_c0_g1_i1.p1 TRINITY_DN86089_c0_g1~~TRINITY_DN86089_c0_g1_i1.p1  ORF type:complete len:365 (+),score=42.78 TRINITY_DN86089_c0_g1_i1:143-1096(+)